VAVAELIVSGRIATLGDDRGFGWVEAVAVTAGRIVAAGRRSDVEAVAGLGTHRLVLGPDEVALPGLTDAHLHLAEGALLADRVDVADAPTLEAGLAQVAAAHRAVADPDAWLEGGGWDPTVWGCWPRASDLESVAPGRRIAIWSHDHHALLVSRRALAEAGIDRTTIDPPGGAIRRDGGEPTGVLHEHASRLVSRRIPEPTATNLDAAIERWTGDLLALGLVAVHDMGSLATDPLLGGGFGAAARLDAGGRLRIRVQAAIREESIDEAIRRGFRTGDPIAPDGRGRARVGWWKRFADGALGSRTAFLREPYEGRDDRGLLVVDRAELAAGVGRATAAGIATAIHAIGDAALDVALDALAPPGGDAPALPARARIEHAQLVHDDQLVRLREAGIALSMQPFHARSDGPSLGPAWGERARTLGYRWRSALDAGVRLAFGTDAPVETPDPWPGLAVAIDRSAATLADAGSVLDARERITLDEALRAAALSPALLAGETDRGRLVPGHRADLLVVRLPRGERLDDPAVLATVRPRLVLVDGAVAFEG
jgi:predicted amidohydrolase YtcJ